MVGRHGVCVDTNIETFISVNKCRPVCSGKKTANSDCEPSTLLALGLLISPTATRTHCVLCISSHRFQTLPSRFRLTLLAAWWQPCTDPRCVLVSWITAVTERKGDCVIGNGRSFVVLASNMSSVPLSENGGGEQKRKQQTMPSSVCLQRVNEASTGPVSGDT